MTIIHWPTTYSYAGGRISSTNTMTISAPSVSTHARRSGEQQVDERGEAHVLAAAQRDHRAQHREPQEQDRRELVGPRQRLVEDVARDHAGEQDGDLGDDQRRRRNLGEPAPARGRGAAKRARRRVVERPRCAMRAAGTRTAVSRRRNSGYAVTPACRNTSPASPTPRRRTCPSTPRRTGLGERGAERVLSG